MGQYYRIAFKRRNKIRVNDLKVKGIDEFLGRKLMEHAYFGNRIVDSVAWLLYRNPTRLIWCGDYAEDIEIKNVTTGELSYSDIWGNQPDYDINKDKEYVLSFSEGYFDYSNKYLINKDKKLYVSFSKSESLDKMFAINPIPLLTVVGNGRGLGDYQGTNMGFVGSWAWDRIEIVYTVPKGYKELEVKFVEE